MGAGCTVCRHEQRCADGSRRSVSTPGKMGAQWELSGSSPTAQLHGLRQLSTGIAQHCPCWLLLQSPSLPASCLMHSPHSLPTNFTQPRGKCLTPSSEHSLLNQPPIIQFGRQLKPGRAFHTASPTPLPLGGCSTSSPHCTWPRSCGTPGNGPFQPHALHPSRLNIAAQAG